MQGQGFLGLKAFKFFNFELVFTDRLQIVRFSGSTMRRDLRRIFMKSIFIKSRWQRKFVSSL